MKLRHLYTCFLLAFALCAYADTIVLHTGARVQGTIVFQNEEVVIVRDASGARSQYPRGDVREVLSDEQAPTEEKAAEVKEEVQTTKRVSILLELAGGAAVAPQDTVGGAVSADLLVGSHHIRDRHIFVGAGVGYHGLFLGGEKYNFLPIQAAVRMPLTEEKHAPVLGLGIGYGVALSKNYLGGFYAGLDFGYRCQLNPKTAISLTAYTQFQQAKIKVYETLDAEVFSRMAGRSLVTAGLKLGLYF